MAMKVTMWCDRCPTLLELEAFEVEIRTKQLLPRQDHNWETKRLHLCGECADKVRDQLRPLPQQVQVIAHIVPPTKVERPQPSRSNQSGSASAQGAGMSEKESPACPKCGYVMCERFDEKPLKDGFSDLIPNGTYKCYHCGIEVKPKEQG